MFTVIQDLSTDDTVVMLEDRSFPAPAVLEDRDGLRALLLGQASLTSLPAHVWAQGHALGAAYLLVPGAEGFLFMSTERFLERRREDARHAAYVAPEDAWSADTALPTYADVIRLEAPAIAVEPAASGPLGFGHLHTHSEYSTLDGLSKLTEMAEAAVADGQRFLAVSDHGNCAAHPDLAARCAKAGLKPIFGMEANLVEDRFRRGRTWSALVDEDGLEYEVDPDSLDDATRKKLVKRSDAKEVLGGYQHITLWAMTQQGLRNLWAMSTEGYRDGFYGRPRIDYDTLARLGEGVIASTGCLRGPLAQPLLEGDRAKAQHNLARLMAIFGDRLYVEIHTNHLEEQVKVNQASVEVARSMGLPMIAAVDAHYATADQKEVHRAWLAMQTDKDLTEDTSLFAGGQDYHMKTADEVLESLAYLDDDVLVECVANPGVLAARCTAELVGAVTTPTFSKPSTEHPDPVQRDVERLIDLCLENWDRKVTRRLGTSKYDLSDYEDRFAREMDLLIRKAFCGYFLVVADYVNWAKSKGCLVGPGRGSGGGSLVAYLAGITELDPVAEDLIFERFLTEGRVSLPDFDVDFPTSWRPRLMRYIIDRWDPDHVLRIGTVTRIKSKSAFNAAMRVLKPLLAVEIPFAEAEVLRKAIDAADAPLAGAHLPWEDFCVEFADVVDPMRARYPEVFNLTDTFMGRVKSYGKHPAGVVVSTGAALTDLPMRVDDDGNLISQFDMVSLEELGYVKFDLLTLRTLDTLQQTIDLVHERFGVRVNPYDWDAEYDDPQVWEQVAAGNTLGLFQIETKAGTRLTRQYQPASVPDLAAVMTLVRPGPKRSGLTDIYLNRRAGLEPVTFPDPRMAEVLGDTYGAIIYQEQVMACCMLLGGYDSTEADAVRKILGKKQVEKVVEAGREFVERTVERGMALAEAETLWAQLAEFAKYGFGKAHAVGYAVLGHWTAWLKFHFPVQFITAALSTVKEDRIPEFINEARRMGYAIGGPDVNESQVFFSPGQMTVRYGLASVKGIGEPTARFIVERAPFASLQDFTERCLVKDSPVNRGHLSTLVAVGAFDTLVDNRRAVEMQLEAESTGAATACVFKNLTVLGPGGLPCTFDWATEPNPPMVARGRGKDKTYEPKPPPKKCTTACRNYTKPEPIDPATIEPYTDADIRDRERELLGVWLSSTPFDRLDPQDLEVLHTTEEIESGPIEAEYLAAAIIERVKVNRDRNNNEYAFVSLNAQGGTLDAICFSSTYEKIKPLLRVDALVFGVLWKTDRGVTLTALSPAL